MRSDDLRFHVASLVAVFLALGIGIFIGTAFVGAPVVERRINTLNRTLADKLTELGRRTDEANKNEEALRALIPYLIGGRLAGRAVLIVRTGDYPEAARDAQTVLETAGARVSAVLTLPAEGWGREAFAANPDPQTAHSTAENELAALAAALLNPSREETTPGAVLVDTLRRAGRLSGDAPLAENPPARLVVLVAGVKGPPPAPPGRAGPVSPRDEQARTEADERAALVDRMNERLAKAFADGGAIVVGAEPWAADRSSIPSFQAEGAASVDAVDRAAGQIALVFALRGDKGAFGLKPTAERVLPESVFSTIAHPPVPDTPARGAAREP